MTVDTPHERLVLEQFCKVPHIDFGSVHPGASATAILTLHNPTGQVQHVAIDPIPDSTLSLHPMEAEVAPESHQDVCLTWTPIEGSVTGKNFRTAISIRTEGRKRFKAIATGTSIIKSGRNGRKKATRPEATFELTEVDENIIRNGPTSIAWNAEFKKVPSTATTSTKPAVQALGTKRNDNSVPFISPSKIVRYFSKEKSKPEGIVEIDIDDGAGSEKIEIVIEGRKNRHGGVAFDADFTIKLPKAQPLKSKLYQAEVSCSKSVDIRPLARKNSASAFAKKRKALTDISRSVLTPVKAKVKASAFSYREGQFFDEDWAKKQENAFKIWLNFVFKERDTPQAFMIEPHQPAYQSIKEFRAHGQILQKAFFCYHSQPVQNIICAIEQAVSSGQLRIRNDINMLNDVGLRDRFVDLFHSYNSAWLKLGLETVYGEMLPSSSCLRTFIQTRLLSNRQLDSEHTYLKTAQGQPFFDENHKSAMQCFVLKKVLQIVIFLDIAKSQNVFPISPRLFTTNGKIKSTRSLLLEFASTFMAAQGDVVKFIAQISQYECASVQAPLDEFDYQLSDLTADLKDGVRLCALSGEPGIERQILLPAINKSRKKHNVTLALQVFAKSGFPSIQCTADDVVEGNRQRVLILIWNIISHVASPALLDLPALFNEIRIIRRQNGKTQTCRLYADNNHYQLLLQWCEQICFRFDISIRNFTSSFSDGRGFAAIISFYCPLLIKESDIKRTTRSLQDQLQKKKSGSLSDHAENMGSAAWIHFLHLQASSDEVNEALEGERHNWRLIANAVRQLGAVPFVFSDHGRNLKQSMILEEKSVLIFLSYLCSRLLVLSKESHAARTVQKRWRDIQWRKRTLMIPNASETILVSLMSCYQYCALRKYLTKIRILQSVICTGLTVKQFCVQWNAACVIGSGWRLYRSRKRSRELQISASTMIGPLQSYIYTSFALRMAFFSSMLQNVFRSYSNNKMFSKTKSSVDLLASELRQYLIWRLTCELQGLIISYSRAKSFGSLQASTKMIHGSIQAYLDHNSFQIHLGNVRAAQCGFLTLLLGKQFHQQLEIVRGVQKRWRQVFCRRRQVEFAVDSLSGSLKSCLNFFAAIGWRSQVRLLQGSCLAHLAKTHFRECRASVHVLEERFAQYNRWRSAFTLQTASVAYIQMKSFRIHQFAAATLCESIRSYRHKRDCDKYFSTVNTLEGSIKTYLVCQQLEKIRCSVRLVSSLLCRYRQYWAAGVFQNRWRQITLRRKRRMIQSASCSLSGPLLSYTQNRLFKSYICHLRCIQGSCEALIGLRAINEARSSVRLIISELMRYRKWNAATCLQRRWLRRNKLIRARKIRTSVKALSGPLRSYCRNRSAKQVLGRSQSIQSLFKAYLINNSFQRFSHSVHVIQSYLHRYCEFSAACVLQRTWRERTRRLRERSIRCAIRTLSGPFASCFHAIAFQQYFSKVATIQALVQAHKNTEAFYRIKAAVCVMESQLALYRKFCTTKLIQSQLHCIYAYRRFTMLHASAKSITAALLALVSVRECIARKKYLITIYSIQTTVNTILRHRDFELHRKKQKLNAIAAIQAAICCVQFSSKTAHLIQARHLRSCIKIQRSARQFIQSRSMLREQLKTDSLRILLASFRCILAVRWSQQFRYQVLRVQSLWRGRRQRLMASKKVRQARERILDASSRWALELTIGYRLKQALDVLLSGSKLSDLTQACRMLDHVTRTLPRCCNDAVEHNAVPVLYALMRGLNRSKPHIELLGYAISILATLSQNPAVSEHVFNDESCLDVTLELLQTQRENPDLFIKVAKLLKIGCTDKSFATELRKSAKRIASIHALLSRKLEMGIRYQQPGSAAHSKQLALLDKSVKSIESLQLKLESL